VANPQSLEVLKWCLPALILGVLLRGVLLAQMPYGFIQYDSADYLWTPFRWLHKHQLVFAPKKSFLTPLFYSIPFLLHIPALIFIPLAQNLMGLLAVVLTGGLVRLWFDRWRWFIVPVTVLMATNPFAIWYEKTLLGEANFLFFTLLVALLGTLWVKNPGRGTFLLFLLGLFLEAGTRGEGKLFFLFGLMLVPVVDWKKWKAMALHGAVILGVMVLTSRANANGNADSLLYGSLVHLTPDKLRFEPEAAGRVLPLRDRYRAEWVDGPTDLVRVTKRLNKVITPYVKEKYPAKDGRRNFAMIAKVYNRLCLDVLLAHPFEVFWLPFHKFNAAVDSWTSGEFDAEYLIPYQKNAATRCNKMFPVFGKRLTGETVANFEQMSAFIDAHYHPESVAWFGRYQRAWNQAMLALRTPDRPMKKGLRWVHDYIQGIPGGLTQFPGMPIYYFAVVAGMVAAMLRRGPARSVQVAWVLCMFFVWWSATLVGVTNGRYRFIDEQFGFIYLLLLVDCFWSWFRRTPRAEGQALDTPAGTEA
jgi:hypothetical protein